MPRTTRSSGSVSTCTGAGCAGERLQQQLCAAPSALEERLADGRQPDVARDLDVVEPDHRQLLRYVDPEAARGLEHAERLHVRRREHGRRRLGEPQQLLRDVAREVAALRPLADVLGPDRDATRQ